MSPRRALGAAALAAVSLVVGLVLAELSLRILRPEPQRYYLRQPNRTFHFEPDPEILPGVHGPSVFRTSSDGLRADERSAEHRYRVLALGGSTTECLFLDEGEAWPGRLQELLNASSALRVWVGNAGRSGRRTREHILQLDVLLTQLGDVDLVLMLLGANDALTRLAEDRAYDPEEWRKPEHLAHWIDRAFVRAPAPPGASFLQRSALARRLWRARSELRWPGAADVQQPSGEQYRRLRAWRAAAPHTRSALPDLEDALAEYAANLDDLVTIAERHGSRILFMTQPSLYRADLPPDSRRLLWMGGVGRYSREPGHDYYSVEALARAFRSYNATLLEHCERRALECIDLASQLVADTSAFYDDVHFNEAGAERVARILFDYLRARPPFDG